jgi:hypothetical protein
MAPNYIRLHRLSKSHFEKHKKKSKSMAHFFAFFKARPKNHVHHANHHVLTINSPQQNHALSHDPLKKCSKTANRTL